MSQIVFIDSSFIGLAAIESAKKLGFGTTLVHPKDPAALLNISTKDPKKLDPYISQLDNYIVVETFNKDEIVDKLTAIDDIELIMTTSEMAIEVTAEVSEVFQTNYPSPQDIRKIVLKNECRDLLSQHQLRTPLHHTYSEKELLEGQVKFPYPFVVKPTRGFAKLFSAICSTSGEFNSYLSNLLACREENADFDRSISRNYVVEQYIKGELHSAEIYIKDGVVHLYSSTLRLRAHYYELLELAAVMPSKLNSSELDKVREYLQQIFDAANVTMGLYHVELLIEDDGTPILVEVNARMMGSVSPIMFNLLTGKDAFEIMIKSYSDRHQMSESAQDYHGQAGITLAVALKNGGTITQSFSASELEKLLHKYEIDFNTLNIFGGKIVPKYEGNTSILGHVIITSATQDSVMAKGNEFLYEMDKILGLETAKYFA